MKRMYSRLQQISFRTHLLISALLRLLLICYAQFHDAKSEVPYTDIDYKVVTDGARQVLAGGTPFARHTYRYSPILAYIQIPNVVLHAAYGKLIYAAFDLLLAVLIHALVRQQLQLQFGHAVQYLLSKQHKLCLETQTEKQRIETLACWAACCWLYNPLTAVISTRGSGDSFSSFFVVLSIYLLLKAEQEATQPCWIVFGAGLAHGFVIHLRLYPLLFSLAYYLCLSTKLAKNPRELLLRFILPNKQQLCLVLGTLLSLTIFTWSFYSLYGWQYIYEAYIYHFVRKDVRHNFSLHFLLQYLSSEQSTLVMKLLILAPQFLLIFYLSLSFGQFRQTLPFCVFSLAFVIVTYNSVVTSQYFVWYLALLPLCLCNFERLSLKRCLCYVLLWLIGQGLWLLPAYLLEFKTWHTFYWIGLQSAVFFIINSYILKQLVYNYGFKSFKVRTSKKIE
ncbi:GPI mannosyltransferase 1 [Drosophila busckii]|uniref:GPI mannosyltransferase 1 n=1 Tax=Drosophila busckii TaxID=30019 RepID=UPI00083EE6AB|nr:GPI mannosyltransferase 1 [Drosophila busckii]